MPDITTAADIDTATVNTATAEAGVKTEAETLYDISGIKFLPGDIVFSRTSGGLLSMKMGDEEFKRVTLMRAFPLKNPDMYIVVKGPDGKKEIGIIKSLDSLPAEMRKLCEEELGRRYFAPCITKIIYFKDEYGYGHCIADTDSGRVKFAVRDPIQSIISLDEIRVIITDADGNRYEIPDVTKLDRRSVRKIATYL